MPSGHTTDHRAPCGYKHKQHISW